MRIEAHLKRSAGKIEVRIFGTSRDRAETMRKAVSSSRYAGGSDHGTQGVKFTYPLSVDKCREMRDQWGKGLRVSTALADWYREASKGHAAQVAITKQTDAKLVRVPALYPKLNAWLKGDQRVTAKWISEAYRGGGLLADEVGTGKTAGVVAGLVEADIIGPTLIVCPKISVKAVWLKELRAHTDIPVYACSGTRTNREKQVAAFYAEPARFKVLVVVAEMLRVKAIRQGGRIAEFLGYEYPALFDTEWAAVVVDESHKLLGSMDVVRSNLAGEGLRNLSYAPNRLKLAVSATPFGKGGRIEALFGTLHWLYPDEFASRWAWLKKYFQVDVEEVRIKGGGGATKSVHRVGPLLEDAKLWEELGPRILRRTMDDVSPDHRGLKHFVEVACELEAPQSTMYRKFAQDGELAVEGGIITTVGTLDYMTRCRQFANGVLRKEGGRVVYTGQSAKIDRLMAHLEGLSPKRKVVVASQFNEFLDVVEKRLHEEGIAYFRLDGSTTERQREQMMAAWQDPNARIPQRVFLLNGQAGGVSITLDAAEELHELDEMYPPEANTQLFGRIFRRGRAHEVFFYLYRSLGTIDERIGYNIEEGTTQQAKLLDGRRGKEYVREMAQYNPEV